MVLIEIIANIGARLVIGAAQLFFAPLYITLLGIEAYGLIGFYLTLLGTLLCIDQAISPAVTRVFATAQGEGNQIAIQQAWRTFHTLERLSLGLGVTLGVALFLAAPWAARTFLHTNALSRDTVETALALMAGILIAQWPSFVYAGALAGLRKQVSLNLLRSVGALLQFTVGVGLVYWAGADITGLLAWHIACSALISGAMRIQLSRLGGVVRTRSQNLLPLRALDWTFAIGNLGIGILGTILTQFDKLLVAKLAPLHAFTAYSLTFAAASLIPSLIAQPFLAVLFPHLSAIFARQDFPGLEMEYRRITQCIMALACPVAAAFCFYPQAIISFWIPNQPALADEIALLLPWVTLGMLFNTIMTVPLSLQLASGWTSLSFYKNLAILPLYFVVMLYGFSSLGPLVGALCWFGVNFSYYLFEVPLMHRRLLKSAMWPWWIKDTLTPLVLTGFFFWGCSLSNPIVEPGHGILWAVLAQTLLAMMALALLLPFSRQLIRQFVIHKFNRKTR